MYHCPILPYGLAPLWLVNVEHAAGCPHGPHQQQAEAGTGHQGQGELAQD